MDTAIFIDPATFPWRRNDHNPLNAALLPVDGGPPAQDPELRGLLVQYAETDRERRALEGEQRDLQLAIRQAFQTDAAERALGRDSATLAASEEALSEHTLKRAVVEQKLLTLEERIFDAGQARRNELLRDVQTRVVQARVGRDRDALKRTDAEGAWLESLTRGEQPRFRNTTLVQHLLATNTFEAPPAVVHEIERQQEASRREALEREFHQRRAQVEAEMFGVHGGIDAGRMDDVIRMVEERYPHLRGISKRGSVR